MDICGKGWGSGKAFRGFYFRKIGNKKGQMLILDLVQKLSRWPITLGDDGTQSLSKLRAILSSWTA